MATSLEARILTPIDHNSQLLRVVGPGSNRDITVSFVASLPGTETDSPAVLRASPWSLTSSLRFAAAVLIRGVGVSVGSATGSSPIPSGTTCNGMFWTANEALRTSEWR
jgi:hypothetical protein